MEFLCWSLQGVNINSLNMHAGMREKDFTNLTIHACALHKLVDNLLITLKKKTGVNNINNHHTRVSALYTLNTQRNSFVLWFSWTETTTSC